MKMDMNMQRISPLWETFPSQEVQPAAGKKSGSSVFGDIFQSLVDNVRESEDQVAKTEYLLSTGQLDNPAQLGIAGYKAELAVSMLIQLRNRALDAYNELKNMNV